MGDMADMCGESYWDGDDDYDEYYESWPTWSKRYSKTPLNGSLMRHIVDERIKWLMEHKQCK